MYEVLETGGHERLTKEIFQKIKDEVPTTDDKVKQSPTNDGIYDILLSGSAAGSAEATEGAKKSSTYPLKYSTHGGILSIGDGDTNFGGVSLGWAGSPNVTVERTNQTTGAKNWVEMGLDDIKFNSNSSGTPDTWDGKNTSLKAALAEAAGSGGGGGISDVTVNNESVVDNNIAKITSYKELTRAEYDALPDSKYTDGILYCIKDTGFIEGERFAPIIYSLEEREVGVWVDGKPLYQKTHVLNSPIDVQSNAWAFVDVGISNIECLITNEIVDNAGNSVNTFIVSLESASSTRVALGNAGRSNITGVKRITLWYTKTTDVPGSGKWASTSVPAVHYSADWHVVGTWWNGKPIYEKTFHFTTENLPADRATIEKIYDFDELVGIDGYFGYQPYSNDFRNYKLGEAPPQLTNKAIYLLCEGNDQVSDIQDLDFNFNGLDRSKVVYISATVRITKTTD